jgi:hypothetical protein
MFERYSPEMRATMQMHRKDLLREAEQDRLLHLSRQRQPGLRHRLLAAVGRVLVDAGRKLQEPLATARGMCVLADGTAALSGVEGVCFD